MVGKVSAAVRVVPVEVLRVIQAEFETMARARVGKLAHNVASKRRRVDDVILVDPAMEHRETVVMFAGDDEILHPAVFRQANPFVRVKVDRVEHARQAGIIGDRNGALRLNPFRIRPYNLLPVLAAEQRIQSPVNHHAIAGLFEPFVIVHCDPPRCVIIPFRPAIPAQARAPSGSAQPFPAFPGGVQTSRAAPAPAAI